MDFEPAMARRARSQVAAPASRVVPEVHWQAAVLFAEVKYLFVGDQAGNPPYGDVSPRSEINRVYRLIMSEDAAGGTPHVVVEGDCISSLAETHGFKWQTLWDRNPELKDLRKNPNALQPGDVVLIPPLRPRYENRPTDRRHKFIRKGVPAKFRLILERFDQPLANRRWTLSVDGQEFSGTTDSKGLLEISLPPEASSGHLLVPEEDLEFDLSFGCLDPSDSITGAQARLQNLGYYDGSVTGEMDEETREALLMFQTARGIPATGELDDRTRAEFEQRHDEIHPQPPPENNPPPPETDGADDKPEDVAIDEAEDERRFRQFEQLDDEED
jgi:N-acetylmuramoyl-L-alanine amidase